jgi:hypothetical protein
MTIAAHITDATPSSLGGRNLFVKLDFCVLVLNLYDRTRLKLPETFKIKVSGGFILWWAHPLLIQLHAT